MSTQNAMATIGGIREIGCPACSVSYRAMKVDKDGVPIIKFAGGLGIRSIEVEATEDMLKSLSTEVPYEVHAVVRQPQMSWDMDQLEFPEGDE